VPGVAPEASGFSGGGGGLRYASRIFRPASAGLAAGLFLASPVAAQDGPDNPATDAGMMPAPQPSAMMQNAADRHFDILEYVVDGNTVLSTLEVEEAVYPFLGEERNAADVDKARDALEQSYRTHGFQTVQVLIPQQGIETGVIHLQVIQNPIGRVRVVDSKYHSLEEIKGRAPSLTEGKVLNTKDVQNDIIALNQQPDLTVTPRLKAGQAPGTVDVDLQVEDLLPLHLSVEINNQYSPHTTELRYIGSVGYDNLWQLGHSVNLSYQIAALNPDDAQVISGSYLARVSGTQLSLLAYGVQSDSNVAAVAGTDVIGKGTIFGARAIVALPGSEGFNHSLTVGVDRKDLSQNVLTGGIPSNAPVLYYPMILAYAATWQPAPSQMDQRAQADGPMTHVGASLNFALPAGSRSNKFDAQRFNALRQFFYLKADVSRAEPLPAGFVLYAKAAGQFTSDPLLSSEQLSAGGANTVRGYLEAERLGDYGGIATVELRSPSFGKDIASFINDWRLIAFADGAALSHRDRLPGEQASFGIAGAGFGTRFTALDTLNGSLDFAFALANGTVTKQGNSRVHFRVWSGF
jgi:hemolysin activation/secretion protein